MEDTTFNQHVRNCWHKMSSRREMFLLALLLGLVFLAAASLCMNRLWVWAWVVVILGLAIFIAALGKFTLCRPMGIFINERNLMSLSRFQVILWTLIIVSAYLVMVFARIFSHDVENPFDIAMDWHIWAVLGLSVSAAIGAPLINSTKGMRQPAGDTATPKGTPGDAPAVSSIVRKAAGSFNQEVDEVEQTRTGILYANPDPKYARFSDLFEGEELANCMYIDIAKVQMFWFSLIAVVGYAVFLLNLFASTTDPRLMNAFPPFSDGFIAILTVSHAAYLGGKSVTHTPSSTG
jgi:hypothetical protein